MFEYDAEKRNMFLKGYSPASERKFRERERRDAYLSVALGEPAVEDSDRLKFDNYLLDTCRKRKDVSEDEPIVSVYAGKKYKPVALKVKPVYTELPDQYRIKREIKGDPLEGMPSLNPKPPDFVPTGRYSKERMQDFDKVHKGEFLWPEERKLVHHLMMEQNQAFAWDDSERGRFKTEFFPPVVMPTIEHKPWVYRNIPIPTGIYDEVCKIVQKKIEAGVYEPSNASYRSRWFTVAKKDGKSLRLVHSLEPLNAVTIAHSGVPPATEELAAKFGGRACGGMFDLYVGYDERLLAEESRDMTTFQTPFGALRLVTLPMGWTNSVPIFHDDVTEILKQEIPEYTIPYIDDVPVRGPASRYEKDGVYETIPENEGIRRFIWEHVQNVNRILQRMKYSGGTFSGKKSLVCAEEIEVLGHTCGFEGRIPSEDKIGAIMNWTVCKDLRDVRSFLGITGVLRAYIPNYAARAHWLQRMTKKEIPFEWGPKQIESMEAVKEGVRQAKALRPIDYDGQGAVVLAVDTSYIAVGFYIYQEDQLDPKKKHYAKFGSRNLNSREARFSQPKRELFGLKEALRMNKRWLFGARKLVVETDAKYIKGMLEHPDMMPNATINRWIDEILMYHFVLRHKAGATFGPDGLSRRPTQPGDPPIDISSEDEADEVEPGPPVVEIVDAAEPQPLAIKDFVDEIDSRGGYFYGIASSVEDIKQELEKAQLARSYERDILKRAVAQSDKNSLPTKYVQQLVGILTLPPELGEEPTEMYYPEEQRSVTAIHQDSLMEHIDKVLEDKSYRPDHFNDKMNVRLVKLAKRFIRYKGKTYRRAVQSQHRLYVEKRYRMYMMTAVHDYTGHRGFFSTKSLLTQRFWWPEMERDIKWFVKTCGVCQERQLQLIRIPPRATHTPSIFEIIHVDIMHMTPASNGCKYIVHGRDNLTFWPEARALRDEKARSIAHWLYEDVLCRWGSLHTIVSDNGESFKAAVKWAKAKWGIAHITISPYNSRANGKIEKPHWDIRQMLYKATGRNNTSKWYWFLNSVLWADRVSIRKGTGCSPYFMVTGAHPILALDIKEATWLVEPPEGILSEEEHIGLRARALAKHRIHVEQMRKRIDLQKLKRLRQYEKDYKAVIKDFNFEPGDLVLMRHSEVESSLDKKMQPRYKGPMIVVARSKGGSYVLAEINGAVSQERVAKFRVLPYFARRKIEMPDGIFSVIDTSKEGVERILNLPDEENETLKRDYLFDDVRMTNPEALVDHGDIEEEAQGSDDSDEED